MRVECVLCALCNFAANRSYALFRIQYLDLTIIIHYSYFAAAAAAVSVVVVVVKFHLQAIVESPPHFNC